MGRCTGTRLSSTNSVRADGPTGFGGAAVTSFLRDGAAEAIVTLLPPGLELLGD
jgi:hypothetical protein